MTRLRPFAPALLVLAVLSACSAMPEAAREQDQRHALLLNLTSGQEDLHAVWMGLQLAEFALLDHDVTVFFNVHSPILASTKVPADLRYGRKPAIREQIATLLAGGARLVVCPACAEAAGITEADLLPGIAFADREAVFGPLLRRSAVVFSY